MSREPRGGAGVVLALDVGEKRTGVAWGDTQVRIAAPLDALDMKPGIFGDVVKLVRSLDVVTLVIGLPRNQAGEETKQTAFVRAFAAKLADYGLDIPIVFQDESLTSVIAEKRLIKRGKPYSKADIDSEAAAIILTDYLESPTKSAALASAKRSKKRMVKKPKAAKPQAKSKAETSEDHEARVEAELAKLKAKKSRRRRWWLTIGASLVILTAVGFVWFDNALKPVNPGSTATVKVSITKGRTINDIAGTLKEKGLIRNRLAFIIYARIYGTTIQAGAHTLSPGQSLPEIAKSLAEAETNEVTITIPPGMTLAQLREVFRENGFKDSEIDTAYDVSRYASPILADRPESATLEGYIFPDTYNIYIDDRLEVLIQKAINELNRRVQEGGLEEKFHAHGLSTFQAITLASIVNQEVSNPNDQKKVAGIFLNRLAIDMRLDADATFVYAARQMGVEATPDLNSPYNTRRVSGLPPGPISNMKYSALEAVADPTQSSYIYFVSGDDGTTHFAVTEAEHLENTRKYCTKLCQ